MADHEPLCYDLIIIGAGTSGCVLANRLSEDPNISILVLEAGEDRSNDARIYTPGLAGSVLDNPEFDWRYTAQPDAGINGRRMPHPRGRVVGGSSAINSLAVIYPSAAEIDAWADLGNKGWDWDTLAPYLLKFQSIVPPSEDVRNKIHIIHDEETIRKSKGPIQTSFPEQVEALHELWVDTFRDLGLGDVGDPLGGHAIGGHISTCHVTGSSHERSHAGIAYLDPVVERKNLTIVKNAVVHRLAIDDEDSIAPTANGVWYSQNGILHKVTAKKEVILAAGAFNTPQILELSGIGNPSILEQHGINIVHANPAVGENLQDHIRAWISFEVTDDFPFPGKLPIDEARKLYEDQRSGPLTQNGAYMFSYTPLTPFLDSAETEELIKILDHHLNGDTNTSPSTHIRNNFIRETILSANEATAVSFLSTKPPLASRDKKFVTLHSMLSHPFSTGTVHIFSAAPEVAPKIEFKYYSHPLDLEIHTRHLKALEKIAETQPLASYLKPHGKRLPEGYSSDSVTNTADIVRGNAMTNYHPCGTCALGSVVDSRLCVKGVRGLRIVDASVIPIIPRGNILATVYAVAERGADIISQDLGLRRFT